jgi:hypothetical protein
MSIVKGDEPKQGARVQGTRQKLKTDVQKIGIFWGKYDMPSTSKFKKKPLHVAAIRVCVTYIALKL